MMAWLLGGVILLGPWQIWGGSGGAARAGAGRRAVARTQGEQAALEALIAGSCAGLGRLVAVEGAAGIGKTALLGQARAEAERMGMGVLTARGSPLEREFAPGVVRQLFEPVLAAASASRRKELLAGSAGQAATLLGQAVLRSRQRAGTARWRCCMACFG
jgi:hypothetical protein